MNARLLIAVIDLSQRDFDGACPVLKLSSAEGGLAPLAPAQRLFDATHPPSLLPPSQLTQACGRIYLNIQ
jgi:hypothetical protein